MLPLEALEPGVDLREPRVLALEPLQPLLDLVALHVDVDRWMPT